MVLCTSKLVKGDDNPVECFCHPHTWKIKVRDKQGYARHPLEVVDV